MSKVRSKSRRVGGGGEGGREGRRDRLAQAMGLWARNKLGLEERNIPAPEELKLLLKDSSSVTMWDHLVCCVDTPGFAELVKKNLQLHLGGYSNERAELHARRVESARELKSLELAVSQMEQDISRLRTDIGTLAHQNELAQRGVGDTAKRSTLLAAQHVKSRQDMELLEEYTRRLQQRKESFCVPEGETSYFTVPGTGHNNTGVTRNMELESACKRGVREACEAVKELLCELSAEDSQLGAEELNRAKEKTWTKVETLLSAHPPASLLQCLCEVVHGDTDVLHSSTVTLDLARDAAQLRCHLDQSGVGEGSVEQTSFLRSFEDHLMEAQLVHIRRSIDCERSRAEMRTSQQVLEEVKGQVEQLLCSRLPSTADKIKRDLLRGVVLQQLEESGCEAMLETLSSLCAGLESAKTQRAQALSALQLKKDRIEQFAKMTDVKQTQIRQLAKLNSASREKLQRQRSELELYVRRKVCGHEGQVLALGAGLLGLGEAELQLFPSVDLERALRTPALGSATCNLTVHRLRPCQPSGQGSLEGLLKALGLPSHSTPGTLITHLTATLDTVEALSKELSGQNGKVGETKSVDVDGCLSVLEQSQAYDQLLKGEGVEEVNKNMLLASQALAHSSAVQDSLREWWEEPAQNSVPWVTQEDMPLSRWLEQWRVLTAKLRQLSHS